MKNKTPCSCTFGYPYHDRECNKKLRDESKCEDIKKIIIFLEKISDQYDDNRPSYGLHNRIFLTRRWEVAKLIFVGVNERNYKKALKK